MCVQLLSRAPPPAGAEVVDSTKAEVQDLVVVEKPGVLRAAIFHGNKGVERMTPLSSGRGDIKGGTSVKRGGELGVKDSTCF